MSRFTNRLEVDLLSIFGHVIAGDFVCGSKRCPQTTTLFFAMDLVKVFHFTLLSTC